MQEATGNKNIYRTYYVHLFGIKGVFEKRKLFGISQIFWTSQSIASAARFKQMTSHGGSPQSPRDLQNTA
jgi:hypothetical protein